MPTETMERKPSFNIELFPEERREPPGAIKYIVWDKDGTIIYQNFSSRIAKYLEEEFNVPYDKSRRVLDKGFNHGLFINRMIPSLLPKLSEADKRLAVNTARIKMKESAPLLFDDVYSTLYKLNKSGYRMGISSRDRSIKIREELKYLTYNFPDKYKGLYGFFEAIVGRSYKKGRESMQRLASLMKVSYEEFTMNGIYIGDTVLDGLAAREANMRGFIARNSHLGSPNYLGNRVELYDAGPRADLVLDNFYSLPDILPIMWPKTPTLSQE